MRIYERLGSGWTCVAFGALLVACGQSRNDSGSSSVGTLKSALSVDKTAVSKLPSIIEQARDQALRQRALSRARVDAASNRIVHVSPLGEIEVVLHGFGPIDANQIAELAALGATVTESLKAGAIPGLPAIGLVQAWVPANALDDVAALPWVAAVTPPDYPEPDITSQGVAFHGADTTHAQGVDGTGISVGVISDGVTSIATAQAAGELPGDCPGTPCVNVLNAGAGDEGTAMLEIVHDMAPGANLVFAGTGGSVVSHINALNSLVGAGVNVIAEDIPFDSEPAFQQGQVAVAGEAIALAGVSVHSSAGNLARVHGARVVATGTGSGPDGVVFASPPPGCNGFTPSNVVAIAPGNDTTFDLSTGANPGGVVLQWSEPRAIFPTAGQGGFTDLNLYLMDTALTQCIAVSTSVQANGTGDTIEFLSVPANGTYKLVVDVQGTSSAVAAPVLDLRMRGTTLLDGSTREGSLNPDANYTGLASSAAAALATTGGLEGFSGGGPVQLGSTTTCPGGAAGPCVGVAGGGPVTDPGPAPTWTAADGVAVSGAGGFGSPFFGTSAAAPHAAACDALVREAQGAGATVASVRDALANTARDQGPVGADPAWGFGVLDCFRAVGGPTARCKDVHVSAGPVCTADVTAAMVDNGSSDPNGDPLTLTLSPSGPFGLTPTAVTLTVSDGTYTDSCTAQVTVTDDTPPALSVPANVTSNSCLSSALVTVGTATATDNCVSPIIPTGEVIASNGVTLPTPIPVVGGQVTLGIGMHTIRWTATDGPNTSTGYQYVTVGTGIQASDSFLVDGNGSLLNFGGGFAAMLNSGSGATRLGNDGRSGDVLSVGPVTVQDRAVVTSSATSTSTVSKAPTATVPTINQFTPVVLPGLPALPSFPPPTLGGFTVNSGTQARSPGSYTSGTINGGTLVLSSGDYFFQSLTINSGVTVRATATTRVFVQNTLVFGSSFRAPTGSAIQPVYLGFAGTGPVTLEAVFDGTLIAPNATINFGTGAGLTYTGSFYAKVVHVNPWSTLVCKAGSAVGTPPVPPDPPLPGNLVAVTQTTTDWGSGYCVVLDVSNPMAVPVTGWTVDLDMNQATIYASWNGNFSGNSGSITINPAYAWNQSIPALGLNDSIGFCANRTVPGSGTLPIVLEASSP